MCVLEVFLNGFMILVPKPTHVELLRPTAKTGESLRSEPLETIRQLPLLCKPVAEEFPLHYDGVLVSATHSRSLLSRRPTKASVNS